VRIVVVDDEKDMADMFATVLTLEGHIVECYPSCTEALDRLESGGVDLLITDLTMAGMDGLELVKQILAKSLLPRNRLIVSTGLDFKNASVRWLTGNKIFVLFKPFDNATLKWCVQTRLAN
jgi:CheY-like chemotaxis protein